MLSLQRLFGSSNKFFDLLEASAKEALSSAEALMELISTAHDGRNLEQFALRRREDKRITQELTELLCSTFITPLEREDIEGLSHVLYRVPKTIEKFAERLLLAQERVPAEAFRQQAVLLKEATETVYDMVRQLRRNPSLDKVQQQKDRLHNCEGQADKLMLELLRDLYGGRYDPLQVIVLRDLYELLEKVIDRCRDAGNVIFQIVLKNS